MTKSIEAPHIQIRPSNANINDSLHRLPCIALPLATPNLRRELLHMLQNAVHFLYHALPIDLHRLVCHITQRNVVYGPIFSEVDGIAIEHLIAEFFNTRFLCKFYEKLQGLVSEEVLGKVEQNL